MSGNSRSSCLQTAPIVSDFCRTGASPLALLSSTAAGGRGRPCSTSTLMWSPEESQLVLAHLKLVAVLELVGFDSLAIDVRSVQGAEVVDVHPVAAPHEQRVVSGDRDVVEEDLCLGAAPDARLHPVDHERLPRATAAGPDDQRGAVGRHLLGVHGLQVAGLADLPGDGGVVALLLRHVREERAALLAVVGP